MKTYVTRTELLAIINAAIADVPECEDCEVAGPVWHLRCPEPDGTNWSDSLTIRGHGRDPVPCFPAAARAAAHARAEYAIRSDEGRLDDIVFEAAGHHFLAVSDFRSKDTQPMWYVTVDSDTESRAFPATVQDTDPDVLRDHILLWWDSGTVPPGRELGSPGRQAAPQIHAAHSIPMVERFIYRSFQIDTNRINSRGELQNMNRLERWHQDGVIHLDMSEVAHDEARAGGSARRTNKALGYIFTMTQASTLNEQEQIRTIERILFPHGAQTENERNDVEIVFNAQKYSRILVTNDGASKSQPGGILGKRSELARIGVTVMRDSDAVAYVENAIRRRDALARQIAEHSGVGLPKWVGLD